jgi:MOSC domain-containing protein YiiM
MKVERIFVAGAPGAPQRDVSAVRVTADAGIEGDRYFAAHDEPGQNVTLVEAEEIEAFLAERGRSADLSCTRRNVVTRGVHLADLVGREFSIGGVRLRGVELCEPCRSFGKRLAAPDYPAAAVVKRFAHRAGLRADILASGVIAVGAAIVVAA